MASNQEIVAPHLNAEVYRNDATGTVEQSYWEYIHFHPDKTLLIGCSELTGRYWDGSAIVGTLPKPGEDFSHSTKKCINTHSSTSEGFFLENGNKILLFEYGGSLSLWSQNETGWKMWLNDITVTEQDDGIMAADTLVPNRIFVSVGGDGYMKVWDITQMTCVRSYNAAHSSCINGVSTQPNSFTNFATASSDQYISIWSENDSKPVCDVLKNDCGIRCVQWLNENKLVFGDEAGILRLVDIRSPEATMNLIEFPAAVHRITPQPESSNVAVCCDNKVVTVCDISEDDKFKVVYEDRTMHTDYVRGLAWNPQGDNTLYSVGYDGTMQTHDIAFNGA